MSIDNLKAALPEYAKDLKLNLGSISRTTNLTDQQLWGSLLAAAAATGSATVLKEIADEAADNLSEAAYNAALGAAAIMGMNNVFYSGKGNLGPEFQNEKAGLRMNIIGNPGIEKVDFDLFSLAVSVIGHCEFCTTAHAKECTEGGISKEGVMDALRIGSIMMGVARSIEMARALA